MKKAILGSLAAALLIVGISATLPVQTRPQPASAALTSDKDPTPPDPYRPSYDQWGNQWTYDGKLMHAVCPNVPDPISGEDNPECKKVIKKSPVQPPTNKSVQCGGK